MVDLEQHWGEMIQIRSQQAAGGCRESFGLKETSSQQCFKKGRARVSPGARCCVCARARASNTNTAPSPPSPPAWMQIDCNVNGSCAQCLGAPQLLQKLRGQVARFVEPHLHRRLSGSQQQGLLQYSPADSFLISDISPTRHSSIYLDVYRKSVKLLEEAVVEQIAK